MARSKSTNEDDSRTFESAMADLEQSVRKLEGNSLGLEASLAEYSRAVEQVEYCHSQLEKARRRIAQLKGITEDGRAVTEPWDDETDDNADKLGTRKRRKED